jgi:hypothetical protein
MAEPIPSQYPKTHDSQFASREAWQEDVVARRGLGEDGTNVLEPLSMHNVEDENLAYNGLTNLLLKNYGGADSASILKARIEAIRQKTVSVAPTLGNPFLDNPVTELQPLAPLVLADPGVKNVLDKRGAELAGSHDRLVELWPKFKETFKQGVSKGIDQGYIPLDVKSRVIPAVEKTSIRVADNAMLEGSSATYDNERDEVGVSNEIEGSINDSVEDSVIHEWTHKLSGGTFKADKHDATVLARPRVGFSTEVDAHTLTRTGLNEAVTQHITMGIVTGDFETFDPDERGDKDYTYYRFRKVMATFLKRSRGIIDVKSVTNAYFEDTTSDGSTEARRAMIREVAQAYGAGALTKLDKLFELSDRVLDHDLEGLVLDRIHAPVMNTDGTVAQQGYIDTGALPTKAETDEMKRKFIEEYDIGQAEFEAKNKKT